MQKWVLTALLVAGLGDASEFTDKYLAIVDSTLLVGTDTTLGGDVKKVLLHNLMRKRKTLVSQVSRFSFLEELIVIADSLNRRPDSSEKGFLMEWDFGLRLSLELKDDAFLQDAVNRLINSTNLSDLATIHLIERLAKAVGVLPKRDEDRLLVLHLTSLLQDTTRSAFVRYQCLSSLGQLRTFDDVDLLLKLTESNDLLLSGKAVNVLTRFIRSPKNSERFKSKLFNNILRMRNLSDEDVVILLSAFATREAEDYILDQFGRDTALVLTYLNNTDSPISSEALEWLFDAYHPNSTYSTQIRRVLLRNDGALMAYLDSLFKKGNRSKAYTALAVVPDKAPAYEEFIRKDWKRGHSLIQKLALGFARYLPNAQAAIDSLLSQAKDPMQLSEDINGTGNF